MMTFQQWQATRRVDHETTLGFHRRVQGQAGPGPQNLKVLDPFVQACWPQPPDDWARVQVLARLVQEATFRLSIAQNQVGQRYITAIQQLLASAQADLSLICGNAQQAARNTDLHALHVNRALVQRTVHLNVYYLAAVNAVPNLAPIDATINQHITNANQLAGYQRAHITFQRVNAAAHVVSQTANNLPILLPNVDPVPVHNRGKFADGGSGGERLVAYLHTSGTPAHTLDVVYLDNYETAQNDVQGRAYRMNDATLNPARPIVTVTLNPPVNGAATYPTTLAHELGHALTGCSAHIADANNLMSGGNNRNGTNELSDGQIAWLRNNPWAL